jgi:hypothetical protein
MYEKEQARQKVCQFPGVRAISSQPACRRAHLSALSGVC